MSSAGTGRAARDPSAPVQVRVPESPAAQPAGTGQAGARRSLREMAASAAPAVTPAAVMAVLGLWGLARDSSISNDEAATRIAAQLSLGQLSHVLRHIDAVHGLYYLLMQGWAAVGTSPTVLRLPSVAAMSAGAALVAILARRLSGSGWTGLFAGLVTALTPVISYYAQTARSYALVFACVAGATLALVTALRAETAQTGQARRPWVAYAALIALGGYLNEMSLLVLAAHAVTVAAGRYRRAARWHWALAGGAGAVLVAPLVLLSAAQHADVSWIGPPNATDLRVLFRDYFAVTPVAAAILVACAVVALLPDSAGRGERAASEAAASTQGAEPAGRARWWRRGGLSLPSVALPLLLVPALLLLGESLVGKALYVDRYVLYGEAGAALLAGAGMYRIGAWLRAAIGQRWLAWVPGVLLCVAVLLLQLGPQHSVRTPQSRLYDFSRPPRYISARARPGDGVLFFDTFFRKERLIYPRDFRNTDDFGMAVPPVQDGTFRGIDKPFATTLPLMLEHRRIWVVGLRPSPRLSTALLRLQSLALTRHFTLASERHFRGIDVTLWVRRP